MHVYPISEVLDQVQRWNLKNVCLCGKGLTAVYLFTDFCTAIFCCKFNLQFEIATIVNA